MHSVKAEKRVDMQVALHEARARRGYRAVGSGSGESSEGSGKKISTEKAKKGEKSKKSKA